MLIPDGRVLDLIWQYIQRTVYDDGLYRDVRHGICRGCPLSPLMGALYLKALDERLEELGLFYARFMDDWVVLTPTRWKLRKAIKVVNQTLAELKVDKHPDKTTIGRITRGFDFLGYHFSPRGVGIAPRTMDRFKERMAGFTSKVRTKPTLGCMPSAGGVGRRPECLSPTRAPGCRALCRAGPDEMAERAWSAPALPPGRLPAHTYPPPGRP